MEVQWIARSPEVRKAAGELSDMVCAETHLSFLPGTRSSAEKITHSIQPLFYPHLPSDL